MPNCWRAGRARRGKFNIHSILMQLKVPKNDAIILLQARLQELNAYDFNPKVWKDRTVIDLQEIFGMAADPWLQISRVEFHTYITAQQQKVFSEGKSHAQ